MIKTFLKKTNSNSKYLDLINSSMSNINCSCFGLNFNEIPFILKEIDKQKILVVNSVNDALKYENQLKSLGVRTFVLTSKLEDFSYSYFNADNTLSEIVLAMFLLETKQIDCLIVLNIFLMQKVINPKIFKENILCLVKDGSFNFNGFLNKLFEMGYKRVDEISGKGEYSVKGDIVNLYPLNFDFPVRISFFDDTVERISTFSLESFEVLQDFEKIEICPLTMYFYENEDFNKLIKSINNERKTKSQIIDLLTQIENRPQEKINSNFILPFIKEFSFSILDFLTDGLVVYLEPKLIIDQVNIEFVNFYSSINQLVYDGILLPEHKNVYINKNDVFNTSNTCLAFLNLNTNNKIFKTEKVFSFLSSFVKNYNQNFNFLLEDLKTYRAKNYTVVLASNTNDKALKLQEFFKDNDIYASVITNINQVKEDGIYVLISSLVNGGCFVEDKLLILGNFNIYGAKRLETEQSKIKKVFFSPKIGEYCVHETHGICKCKSLEKVTFNGITKDYIVLEFFGGDTLFLPSEKTNLITKFVGETENPKLNKLGSNEFTKEKAKVRQRVKEMAFDLLTLYAKREKNKGFKFEEDSPLQLEFENAFPFELTDDQVTAIKEMKKDMQSDGVMDRLICGDVGYGKTEVALVGAFKAILSGKQVAFMSPTTILSQQHYKNCLARMKSFMVNVEVLNRFTSTKEVKRILNDLKEGKVDIICGTHRLLSKDVVFKDLGLLILDEEQRFGVEDKEKIKNLKSNIDVLTLSATPIPRTLHMSLIGVRDISIIDTPPKNRIPVQTIVTEYNDAMIKNAINKELGRDGQVLLVYNRVESINTFAEHIRRMFEDKVVLIAHGQMDKKHLEDVINKVYNKECDILISTVLIENGIDLPSANTIIITNSDKLGLSQLYQLKGRVGRSGEHAYAYFTYQSQMTITEEGHKRLMALSEFSSLGSGFKIAMKDLEIRGAGEILGSRQSGHIERVGYDMYTKILKEAVMELKGEKEREKKDCKMEVAISGFIPKDYVENDSERLSLYEQISHIKTFEEKEKVEKILLKNYKQLNEQVSNLILVALLKNLLIEINAKRFVLNKDKMFIEFYEKSDILQDKVSEILTKNKKITRLNLSSLPIIEFNVNGDVLEKLNLLINILINNKN